MRRRDGSKAIEKWSAAGASWRAAVSRRRCANTRLAGSDVSELLRDAHRRDVELGAQPLQHEVDALARMARITLREPAKEGAQLQLNLCWRVLLRGSGRS